MRLVSDFGGRPAGPIDRTEHPLGAREKRIDAMKTLMQRADPVMTSDASRRAQEDLPAELYEGLAYYDRWLLAFRANLQERGHLDSEEIDRRVAEIAARAGGPAQG
ncbi:MAG: ScnB-like protein [Alphaproteobacteria bacterium]